MKYVTEVEINQLVRVGGMKRRIHTLGRDPTSGMESAAKEMANDK